MAFITQFFIKPKKTALVQSPTGSFAIDRKGQVIASTLPQSFQSALLNAIGKQVLATFRSAEKAQMRLVEIIITYSALKLVAREQRGGAIVFLCSNDSSRASGEDAQGMLAPEPPVGK